MLFPAVALLLALPLTLARGPEDFRPQDYRGVPARYPDHSYAPPDWNGDGRYRENLNHGDPRHHGLGDHRPGREDRQGLWGDRTGRVAHNGGADAGAQGAAAPVGTGSPSIAKRQFPVHFGVPFGPGAAFPTGAPRPGAPRPGAPRPDASRPDAPSPGDIMRGIPNGAHGHGDWQGSWEGGHGHPTRAKKRDDHARPDNRDDGHHRSPDQAYKHGQRPDEQSRHRQEEEERRARMHFGGHDRNNRPPHRMPWSHPPSPTGVAAAGGAPYPAGFANAA